MRLIATLLLAIAAGLAYLKLGRPRVLDWNATPEEASGAMPGDELLPDATMQTTRVITVDAPPQAIWPWLLQMGPRPRAGIYTYDWVERLLGIDIQNADRILPEFQHLEPGQMMVLNGKGVGIQVMDVQDLRAIVLQWVPEGSTWTFGLYPRADGTTRLVSRNRLRPRGPIAWAGMVGFMEPGSLVMERKMLLGIKERAEKLARDPEALRAAVGAAL